MKHSQNMSKIDTKQVSLKTAFSKGENKITKFELQLSVYVACHSTVNSIDHLCDLLKKDMPSTSSSETLRLHRTKCSALIKKVISPALLRELVSEMRGVPFSLIIDESTDIACVKHLCVCVRFYNATLNKMASHFLGLIPVTSTTAESLYQHIKDLFR